MKDKTAVIVKTLVGKVVSDKMAKTVVVEVTTSKRHPLYHKRYRWTDRYLADTTDVQPQLGDMAKIIATKPLSRLKRWKVAEVVTVANQVERQSVKKASQATTTAPKSKSKTKSK